MATLADAYLRLDRADEHLREIHQLAQQICSAQAEATRVAVAPGKTVAPGELAHLMTVESASTPIPARLGVLVGDCLNSLRSCLDYLVGELAELDSGEARQRTQFPVEQSPEAFRNRRQTFLRGVSDTNVAQIESLQPYNEISWTAKLSRLSNWDKHNKLVLVAHDYLIAGIVTPSDASPSGQSPLKVELHLQPSLRIQFEDGLQLLKTLDEIRAGAGSTLDFFAPQFGTA